MKHHHPDCECCPPAQYYCGLCQGYDEGFEAGRKSGDAEGYARAIREVVVFLRSQGEEPIRTGMQVTLMTSPATRRALRDAADEIEHGEHKL